jgi:hypothetical protein
VFFLDPSILACHFVFFNKNKREKLSCSFSLLKTGCHVSIKGPQKDTRKNSIIYLN